MRRAVGVTLAVACGAGALALAASGGAAPPQTPAADHPAAGAAAPLVRQGRRLFLEGCSSCHGETAHGIRGRAPSLHGVGELSADFYLRTGRMPLDEPKQEPVRGHSPYTASQRHALVAYVGSLGGPPIPAAHPERGNLSDGQRLFTEHCAGCHQVMAQGGIVTKGVAPDLRDATPTDVAEAVKVGPYVMPNFRKQLDQAEIDSISRYVDWTKRPDDRGGWGIGHVGPIPEGMVAWLLAGMALVLVIRLIGEREPR